MEKVVETCKLRKLKYIKQRNWDIKRSLWAGRRGLKVLLSKFAILLD